MGIWVGWGLGVLEGEEQSPIIEQQVVVFCPLTKQLAKGVPKEETKTSHSDSKGPKKPQIISNSATTWVEFQPSYLIPSSAY